MLFGLMFLAALAGNVQAMPIDIQTLIDSGTTTCTNDIAAKTNSGITIWSIDGWSDKAGSLVKIYVGAEAGVTTSYTQIFQYDLGNASVMINEPGDKPLFNLGSEYKGYQARVVIDGTSAVYGKVNYEYR